MKLARMFRENALRSPEDVFLCAAGVRMDYASALKRVVEISGALAEAGFAPGSVVGLAVSSPLSFVTYFLGLQEAGLVPLLLNMRAGRDEMHKIVSTAGINVIISDCIRDGGAAEEPVSYFCPDAPDVKEKLPSSPMLSDGTIFLLTTSGTGGNPKIVKKKDDPVFMQSEMLFPKIEGPRQGKLRYFVNVPLWHSYGIEFALFGAIYNGAELHAADFSFAESAMKYIRAEGITHVFSVPPFIAALTGYAVAIGCDVFSELEMVISAGMRIPPRTSRAFFEAFGFNISSVYGITEVGCVAFRPSKKTGEKAYEDNNVGFALAGNTIAVRPCPGDDGAIGRGMIVIEKRVPDGGYYAGASGDCLEKWSADLRTFVTDDIGYLDGEGSLHLLGRNAAYINVGGEKINSFDVENALRETNLVREAIVWAGADDILGERILAAVVLEPGIAITGDVLREKCIGSLPMIKVPREIAVFENPFPKTATGKIRFDEVVREFNRLTERKDAR